MIKNIVFDLGGVLIDWNPRYLYRKIFDEKADVEKFLEKVCTMDWNIQQDAGNSLAGATQMLVNKFPEREQEIRAYYDRWPEMLGGDIRGTVEILRHLIDDGRYRILALTNWSAETFPLAQKEFEFLSWFEGIVVSGAEKCIKPFPEIYQILLERYDLQAEETIFIDDNSDNIIGAEVLGIHGLHFTSPNKLLIELAGRNII